jgi:hypothetical protein
MAEVKIVIGAGAIIAAGAIGWFLTRCKKPVKPSAVKTAEEKTTPTAEEKTTGAVVDQKQNFENPYKEERVLNMVHLFKTMSSGVVKPETVPASEESASVGKTSTVEEKPAETVTTPVETPVVETPTVTAVVETPVVEAVAVQETVAVVETVVAKTIVSKDVEKNSDPRSEFGQKLKDALDTKSA